MTEATVREQGKNDFDWSDVFGLHPDYRLRPDVGRAVLVNVREANACKFKVIDTRRALVIALMDGKRTLRTVAEMLAYLGNLDAGSAERAISNFMLASEVPLVRVRDLPAGTRIPESDPAEIIAAGDSFSRRGRLGKPIAVLWIPSLDCVCRCRYCYMNRRPVARDALLSDERIRELIREFIDLKLVSLSTGGEFFALEKSFDYLELLAGGGLIPYPLSTKVPLRREQIRRLVEIGVKVIQYSIDGPNAEICDFLVRTPGWFTRSVESVRMMVEAGLHVIIHVILTGYSARYAEETARFFRSLGVPLIRFSGYNRSIYHHSESLWLPRADSERLKQGLKKLQDECPQAELVYFPETDYSEMDAEAKARNFANRSRCSAYTFALTIMPDGSCLGCEQMPQDEEFTLGNVRDRTILEVWNSKRAEELAYPARELFRGTVCFDCPDFDECHEERGYCFRMAYQAYGTIYAPSPNCPRAPKGLKITGCV